MEMWHGCDCKLCLRRSTSFNENNTILSDRTKVDAFCLYTSPFPPQNNKCTLQATQRTRAMMQNIAMLYLFADSNVFLAHEDLRGSGSRCSLLLLSPCTPTRQPQLAACLRLFRHFVGFVHMHAASVFRKWFSLLSWVEQVERVKWKRAHASASKFSDFSPRRVRSSPCLASSWSSTRMVRDAPACAGVVESWRSIA